MSSLKNIVVIVPELTAGNEERRVKVWHACHDNLQLDALVAMGICHVFPTTAFGVVESEL
jgi:hypothetical protein